MDILSASEAKELANIVINSGMSLELITALNHIKGEVAKGNLLYNLAAPLSDDTVTALTNAGYTVSDTQIGWDV